MMTKRISIFIFSFLLIFAFGLSSASAQCPDDNSSIPCTNEGESTNLQIRFENPFRVGDNLFDLLRAIITNILLPIGGILAVLAFIYSGFLYVTAQGKPADIQKANTALMYSAIGTAILLGSWVIAEMIKVTVESLM